MHRYWVLIKNRFFNRTRTHKTRNPKHTITGDLQTFIKGILKKNYGIEHVPHYKNLILALGSVLLPEQNTTPKNCRLTLSQTFSTKT